MPCIEKPPACATVHKIVWLHCTYILIFTCCKNTQSDGDFIFHRQPIFLQFYWNRYPDVLLLRYWYILRAWCVGHWLLNTTLLKEQSIGYIWTLLFYCYSSSNHGKEDVYNNLSALSGYLIEEEHFLFLQSSLPRPLIHTWMSLRILQGDIHLASIRVQVAGTPREGQFWETFVLLLFYVY